MTHIRLRSENKPGFIDVRVFIGPDRDHLALSGTLVLDIGEW